MEKAADQLSTADGRSKFLPVKAVYCDGGFYSEAYMCHNMLKDDTSCYCSFKRSGINVVCALPELEPLTVSSIEVIAPSTGYTCPIRQGVVFSCWNWPSLSSLARYGQAHSLQEVRQVYEKSRRRQEESWQGARRKEGHGGGPAAAEALQQRDQEEEELLEPILFFDMDTSYHCSFALNVPRSGRFLVVKLLSSRNRGLNIDVQFVGFRGWTGPTSFAHGAFI